MSILMICLFDGLIIVEVVLDPPLCFTISVLFILKGGTSSFDDQRALARKLLDEVGHTSPHFVLECNSPELAGSSLKILNFFLGTNLFLHV